ncbi:unnamed protein product [Cuscuta epithymum]|uniref:Retrotransposon gag domain-containing protein n=1 Tax=Cuscuta epithymum TaxID=186058 RepID=A0AAV0C585_9ASTE|nr:unnamed protein product [Cuscuta epithymum]
MAGSTSASATSSSMAPSTMVQPLSSSMTPPSSTIVPSSPVQASGSSSSISRAIQTTSFMAPPQLSNAQPWSPIPASLSQRFPSLPPLESYRLFNMPEPFSWAPSSSTVTAPASTVLPSIGNPVVPFAGPTLSGQPGIQPHQLFQQTATPGLHLSSTLLSSLASHMAFSTPNVNNIVTTRLSAVEDYLPWRTQFESFLVSHSLLGILDGSIPAPLTTDHDYPYWLKIDQTIRSWLFATLARDILMEDYDLKFSHLIWERLQSRFMSACFTRSIELKRALSHVKKKDNQTMDQYLLEIKITADNLATINSPVSNWDLIEYAIIGLGRDYESLITAINYFPGNATLENLRPILQAQEHHNNYLREQDALPTHQAFAAAQGGPPAGPGRGGAPRGGGGPRGGRGQRGGRRARGGRGRGGRGYYQQFQQYGAPPYGQQQPYAAPPGPPVALVYRGNAYPPGPGFHLWIILFSPRHLRLSVSCVFLQVTQLYNAPGLILLVHLLSLPYLLVKHMIRSGILILGLPLT